MIFFGALLLMPTLFLWLWVVGLSLGQHGSDAAGNAMTRGFAGLGAIVLWVFLMFLLLLGAGHGEMPSPAGWIALVMVPASGFAAVGAITAISKQERLKWPIIVPVIVPGLLIFYSIWCFFPSMHSTIKPLWAAVVVWGTTAVFCCVPLVARMQIAMIEAAIPRKTPEELAEEERLRAEAYRQQVADSFHSLTADSPLQYWWQYVRPESEFRQEALEGARTSKSRQTDIVTMLESEPKALFLAMPRLDLGVTPEIEQAVRKYLLEQVNRLMPYRSEGTIATKVVTDWYEDYFPTIMWFIEHGGTCDGELKAMGEAVCTYPDSPERQKFMATLEEIRGR